MTKERELYDQIARMQWHTHSQDEITNQTGWIPSPLTWTYASASSFTVAGDVTAILTKGTYLKFTQTTTKYAVVASSSYSSPNTTVNIIVNTDYTIANAAISNPYYSYAANPQGWPGWFNYNPTRFGYSTLPVSCVYRYAINGRLCHLVIRESAPGISNSSTTTYTLPITAATITNGYWAGPCAVMDNGVLQTSPGILGIISGENILRVYKNYAFNSLSSSGNKYIPIGSIEYEF